MSSALSSIAGVFSSVSDLALGGMGACRTTLTILINGQNVTSIFPPIEQIHVRYEDEISFQADNLEVICPDIGDIVLNNPNVYKGASLRLIIDRWNADYPGSHTQLDTGEFDIDQIKQSGPPTQITLLGTSVPIGSHLKFTLKNRIIQTTSVKGLAQQVANENNMKLVWDVQDERRNAIIEQGTEHSETDLQMLARICKERALGLKITGGGGGNGTIYIFDEQAYEMKPAVYTIDWHQTAANGIISWRLDSRSQDIYSEAEFAYMHPDQGGADSQVIDLPETKKQSGSGESLNNWHGPYWVQSEVPEVNV